MRHHRTIRSFCLAITVLLLGCGGEQALPPVLIPPPVQSPPRSFAPSPVATPKIPSFETTVTNFGALPSDGVDDTAAIQRALDAVNAAGGGTLIFTEGRYDVAIDGASRRALTLYARTRLLARPGAPATIRLADRQPSYESVMATASYPTRLDDVEFVGLTFDANGLNNPIRDPEETNGDAPGQTANPTLRYFIRSFAGSRVRLSGVTFTNADVGNSVSFNGTAITDVIIENSKFINVGGALIDHDHSSVYFDGRRARIANNEFRSRNGAGTIGARTAIETHGDDVEVRDNLVEGFLQGINIVGRITDPSRQLMVRNRLINVAVGVNIWPLADSANNGPAFTSLTVRDNDITIDADRWWRSPAMVIGLAAGIHFEAGIARARLERLEILDNRITFDNFAGERPDADRVSVGIGVRGIEGALTVTLLNIARNHVRNAIGPCILSTAIIGGEAQSQIADNVLTDCARSPHLIGAGDALRTGIAIGGTTSNLLIRSNMIRSTLNPASLLTSVFLGGHCIARCFATSNGSLPVQITGVGWLETGP